MKKILPIFIIFSLVLGNISPAFAQTEFGYEHLPYSAPQRLNTDLVTGSFSFQHSFVIPPGRNNMQPQINIFYNSFESDISNLFGYGWNVSIPYIERQNKKGVDKLYTLDHYYSSLSGELEKINSTTYGSKVDNGEFLKYEFSNNIWKVYDKKGNIYIFGLTTGSRQNDPSDSSRVFKWMLEEVQDTNGNFVKYEYFKDAGQIYPNKVFYTGNNSSNGIFEIEFLREAREDSATTTNTGFDVITNHRINEIQSKVNGNWARKLHFEYTSTTDRSVKSLLESITESGRDEQGNTHTLPITEFEYQTRDRNQLYDWASSTQFVFPTSFVEQSGYDRGVRLADLTGDGLVDVLEAKEGVRTIYRNKGDGTGWVEDTNYTPVEIVVDILDRSGYDKGVRIADVNGDKLMDFVELSDHPWIGERRILINKGYGLGWEIDYNYSTTTLPSFLSNTMPDFGVRLVDLNGDDLVDIMQSLGEFQGGNVKRVFINKGDGTGWEEKYQYNTSTVPLFVDYAGRDQGVRFLDMNGDGLDDIIRSYLTNNQNGIKQILLSKGGEFGWEEVDPSLVSIPAYFVDEYSGQDFAVRFGDVNGDTLIDLMFSKEENQPPYTTVKEVYINKGDGTGWEYDSEYKLPGIFVDRGNHDQGWREADVDGDGLLDFINAYNQDPKVVYLARGKQSDLLSKVKHAKGAETKILYKNSQQYIDSSENLLSPDLPFTIPTVHQLVKNDGLGGRGTTTHQYFGGYYHFANPYDRKFAGFSQSEEINSFQFITKTFFHQGNQANTSTGEYIDDVSKIGKSYRTEKYATTSDNLYSKIINTWDHLDLGNNRDFIKLIQSINFNFDGNATHKDAATSYAYNNSNGNLTQRIEWGEVSGSEDGTFTDVGSDKFTTNIFYASSSTQPLFTLPSQETVTDQSLSKVKESKLYYDSLSQGSLSKGNETKRELWKIGNSYIDTEKTYNSYGLVTQEKDPRDNVTNYFYDSENLYVTTSTNSLNHTTTFSYDYSSGKVASSTNPNGRTAITLFDPLDREKEIKQPDIANPNNFVTKTLFSYTDAKPVSTIQKTEFLDSSLSFDTFTYLDGFERIIQERKEAEDTNIFSIKDFIYNPLGLLEKESLPYFSSGSARTSATTSEDLFTEYAYDPLNRVKTLSNILGTTTNAYDDWKVTIIDAESNQKELSNDAYARLTKVRENNNNAWYDAGIYSYNYFGNLALLTDADGNIRNFTYDGLGRRLTAQDLHTTTDATFGSWTYTYDDSGNMMSVVDPKSQTTNYTYDDVNRVLTEDYTGQAGTEVSHAYDSCLEGVGRLCTSTTSAAITRLSYNALGLVKDETRIIDGTQYFTKFTYDRQGNTTLLTYPDNSEVKYEYNTAGFLEKVSQKESGGAFADIVSDFDYSPTGQVAFEKFSNGLETKYIYDAGELYRLKRLKTSTSTADFGMSMMSGLSFSPEEGIDEEGNFSIAILDESATVKETSRETEISEKRTENSKTYSMGKDSRGATLYKTEFYSDDIYYYDKEAKQYDEVNTALESDAQGWHMDKASYKAKIKNTFSEDFVTFENKGQKLSFSSVKIVSDDVNTSDFSSVIASGAKQSQVVYPNALGQGMDMEVRLTPSSLAKVAVIESLLSLGDISRNEFYEIPFKLTSDKDIDIEWGNKLLSGENGFSTSDLVAVRDSEGGLSYILPPYARDVNGNTIPIEIAYEKKTDGIYLTKKLPVSWLLQATYPVTTDATLSYNSGSGDGWIDRQDYTWDLAHDATAASNYYYTSSSLQAGAGKSSSGYTVIERGFLPFTTASIPDGADILDAKLKVYVASKENSDNDGDDWLSVVQTTQASIGWLVSEDYDQCGSINNPTEGIATSERKDISNISTSQYLIFTLNDTGKSWISKTAYTKLGLREGHDVIDSPITVSNGQSNRVSVTSSEGTNKPILEVTYTLNPQFMQELTYTYDKVGNITKIKDTSWHDGSKIQDFSYDSLYRLSSTTVTFAKNNQNYYHNYSYNKLGNIINKSDIGQYLYQGDQGTNYANPHAVTSVNNKTYTYDNNGNLTNNQEWAFTWDYKNRLTQTASSSATSTYAYDHTGQRVKMTSASTATHFANKYYNSATPIPTPSPTATPLPTKTKHIYALGKNLATITGTTTQVMFINHNDHLGGSSVMSDKNGRLEELIDYYPFGSIRIDQSGENSFKEQRKFTGHEYDSQTSLTYMGARYYPGDVGRFLSQDPAFLAVGSPEFENISNMKLQQALRAPQLLNSYSYAINNPLRIIDPDGKWFKEFLTGQQSWGSFQIEIGDAANYLYDNSAGWKAAMDHPIATGAVVGVGSGLAAYAGAAGITAGVTQLGLMGGTQADKAVDKIVNRSWSSGRVANSAQNLMQHFDKHGQEFNAKSASDYYNKANQFINSKSYDFMWKEGTDTVRFNSQTNVINITNKANEIKSFYTVTDPAKLQGIGKITNNISK